MERSLVRLATLRSPAIRFAATLLAVAPFFAVACGNAAAAASTIPAPRERLAPSGTDAVDVRMSTAWVGWIPAEIARAAIPEASGASMEVPSTYA